MRTTAFCFLFFVATLAAEPPKITDAIRADIQLMRERVSMPGGTGAVYATGQASAAARRVFSALPLSGMTRQEAVKVLGEPSKFVAASPASAEARLVYRFDHGYDGVEFILTLDAHGRITKVSSQTFD